MTTKHLATARCLRRMALLAPLTLVLAAPGHSDAAATQRQIPVTVKSASRVVRVVEAGASTFRGDLNDEVSYAVILRNRNNAYRANGVVVRIRFKDAQGAIIEQHFDDVTGIPRRRSTAVAGTGPDFCPGRCAEIASVRVRVTERSETRTRSRRTQTISGVSTDRDYFGDWVASGTIDQPWPEPSYDVPVVTVLRRDDGRIVGGDWTYLDAVYPGPNSFEGDSVSGHLDIDPSLTQVWTQWTPPPTD
jgi:hypothetical protein